MKNLMSFRKGSQAAQDEMHLVEKIRVLANRYADGETADLLTALVAYTKINGPARKLSSVLDLSPNDYAKALNAAKLRLCGDPEFNKLFHSIRAAADEAQVPVPRFPAAAPYSP